MCLCDDLAIPFATLPVQNCSSHLLLLRTTHYWKGNCMIWLGLNIISDTVTNIFRMDLQSCTCQKANVSCCFVFIKFFKLKGNSHQKNKCGFMIELLLKRFFFQCGITCLCSKPGRFLKGRLKCCATSRSTWWHTMHGTGLPYTLRQLVPECVHIPDNTHGQPACTH